MSQPLSPREMLRVEARINGITPADLFADHLARIIPYAVLAVAIMLLAFIIMTARGG